MLDDSIGKFSGQSIKTADETFDALDLLSPFAQECRDCPFALARGSLERGEILRERDHSRVVVFAVHDLFE